MAGKVSEAFKLIAQYAEAQGWIPIGFRSFTVGPWDITVNGTPERRDDIDPWHARVVHQDIVAFMVLNPLSGSAGGWKNTEMDFIRDMHAALHALKAQV